MTEQKGNNKSTVQKPSRPEVIQKAIQTGQYSDGTKVSPVQLEGLKSLLKILLGQK